MSHRYEAGHIVTATRLFALIRLYGALFLSNICLSTPARHARQAAFESGRCQIVL